MANGLETNQELCKLTNDKLATRDKHRTLSTHSIDNQLIKLFLFSFFILFAFVG